MKLTDQEKGLLITTAGVLAFCPDTLLIRLLEMDRWALIFYRGLMVAIGLTFFNYLFYRGETIHQFKNLGFAGAGVALFYCASTTLFVSSLYYTSVANTLIILSTSSMFSALFSRIFLKEKVHKRTIITMVIVTLSIGYIVSDSLDGGHLLGDVLAIGASMSIAGAFTLTRLSRASNMVPATALSGLLVALIAFWPASFESFTPQALVYLLLMGFLLMTALGLLTVGPRYITAPEVSLLLPIETVVGPLIVWAVLGEEPSAAALIGGAVVIAALTAHSFIGLRSQARPMV